MRAVGYFAEGAVRDGVSRSIADQNRDFLAFCAAHGYDVAATFVELPDGDHAAAHRQLIDFLERGERRFIVVVIDSVAVLGDDLARSAVRLFGIEATGARVVALDTGEDAAEGLVAAWERAAASDTSRSRRVREAMRSKAVQGTVLGRAPYGYRAGVKGKLELVPDEAAVVRSIFDLYLHENLGIRKIAGELNEHQIPTRRNGRWSMVTIRDILRNRVYLGTYSRFGVRVPGSHPPLVTQEEFRSTQERLSSRATARPGRNVQPYLLSGLARCGKCGNRMIGVSRSQSWTTKAGEKHKASYRYYQCESRTNQSRCRYNTQRAAELEESVRQVVADEAPAASRLSHTGQAHSFIDDAEAAVRRGESQQRRIRRQIEALVEDAAAGRITLDRVREGGAALAAEQREVEADMEHAREMLRRQRGESERREQLAQRRKDLAARWERLDFDARQRGLREIVDTITVDKDEVKVYLRV